jgi:hypothetical protein
VSARAAAGTSSSATSTRPGASVTSCTTSDTASCAAATAVVHACHRTTAVAETQGEARQNEREMEPHGTRIEQLLDQGRTRDRRGCGPETLRNLMDGRGFPDLGAVAPVGAAQARSGRTATQPGAELHSLDRRWRRRREWHVRAGHRDVDELGRVGLHVLLVNPWQLLQYLVSNAFPKFAYVS